MPLPSSVVCWTHLTSEHKRLMTNPERPPLAIIHPSYLEDHGELNYRTKPAYLRKLVEASRGRHVFLFADQQDCKHYQKKASGFLRRILESAETVTLVPTDLQQITPYTPASAKQRRDERMFLRYHQATPYHRTSREKRWTQFANFLKSIGVHDLDAAGVQASVQTDAFTGHPLTLEEQENARKALATKRGLEYRPEPLLVFGCLPRLRTALHERGITVLLPKGLTRPDSEEYSARKE